MVSGLENARILIVDDDLTLLDALSEALVLRMGPITIDTCDNGAAALKKLAENDYDAIISDIKMPGMDGLTLLARLSEIVPDIPTLLITGHGELDLAIRALRAGAFDLVQKPLDRDHLIAALKRAIETRRLRREVKEAQEALRGHANELEQRVEERTAELKKALRAKDEFLALVSHELRTPVSVIFGNIELMSTHGDKLREDDKATAMTDLRRETRRLRRLVENVLALARVEYGVKNEPLPVSLATIVRQQVDRHRQMYPERPITAQLPPQLPPVLCDELSVDLVLGNLLANAEKYSPTEEPIELAVHAEDGRVVVSVRDRGPGVPREDAERIFDPFYRSESSVSVKGVGIGLAVCKRLLEAYGGRVWLSAHDGGGSDFSFSLPLVPEPHVADISASRAANKVEA
jgi:two-component system, sensor histidine kinase and response regulator